MIDSNEIIRLYLATQSALSSLIGGSAPRIYCPKLTGATLPALSFLTRGGTSSPYIPAMPGPSVQFSCWGSDPIIARQVYRALYDSLQGIENQAVTISGVTRYIVSAVEEVQGQDLQDPDAPYFYKVLTYFSFKMR